MKENSENINVCTQQWQREPKRIENNIKLRLLCYAHSVK